MDQHTQAATNIDVHLHRWIVGVSYNAIRAVAMYHLGFT